MAETETARAVIELSELIQPSPSARRRAAVLGGGIIGVSTARHLAAAGAEVILVTERELANSASGRSLSWLNSAGVRGEPYHALRTAGIDRYRALAARLGDVDWLRFGGGLAWTDGDTMRRHHEHETAHGYDSRLLTAEQVSDLVPGVDPAAVSAAGALYHPGEGWVDLPSLSNLLIKELVEQGGRVVTNAGSSRVQITEGVATGIRTAAGEVFDADVVVLATGSAVPAMAAELGVGIPDATPISLLVTTKPVDVDLRTVLNTPRASVRPTPSGSLAVDADWTARGIVAREGGFEVSSAVVDRLLAEASRLLAGHPALEADRTAMGPKPIPGDGDPVLGRVDEVDGLVVAFTHSGATLALIAGELLAYEITTGHPHPMLVAFNQRRFA